MKEIIEQLFKFDRYLLGAGYSNALKFINHLIPLDILSIDSGAKLETWTVPDEWVIKDAWIKNEAGEKVLDYSKNPLSVVVGSLPVQSFVSLEELKKHLHYSDDKPDATPYVFKFYDKDWGFCLPKNQFKEANLSTEPLAGVKMQDGKEFVPKFKDKWPDERYEVFIDSEYRPGKIEIGIHTIKGQSDREILLFAHLDHAFQANDNLSGVACLIDFAMKVKSKHTIKIIFCPETIGSIGYALREDLSKVECMIALDICGNDGPILLQRSLMESRINAAAHLAIHSLGQTYNVGKFRNVIGSDEYVFNDPEINIPGIMLSRFPYPEYHTSEDTPDKIKYEKIEEMQKILLKIIEIYDNDYYPVKGFKGPLMRSKYGIQSPNPQVNLSLDYLVYKMTGEKSVAELAADYGLAWEFVYKLLEKMKSDGNCRTHAGKIEKPKIAGKKHKGV
jgi:aminopeptidase-like protein